MGAWFECGTCMLRQPATTRAGTVPFSWFPPRFSVVRFERSAKLSGMLPEMSFVDRSSVLQWQWTNKMLAQRFANNSRS